MSDDALPVIKGTLDLMVLRALSAGEMHGFEIMTWLEQRTDRGFDLDDHALYQALHRMEGRGLIAAEWGETQNNRRARYYSVTSAGRAHLKAETKKWVRSADLVTAILTGPLKT
jgi:PadR family transcriptional regulator, regulatory protein PadR